MTPNSCDPNDLDEATSLYNEQARRIKVESESHLLRDFAQACADWLDTRHIDADPSKEMREKREAVREFLLPPLERAGWNNPSMTLEAQQKTRAAKMTRNDT